MPATRLRTALHAGALMVSMILAACGDEGSGPVPLEPAAGVAVAVEGTSATVTWSASGNADSYRVELTASGETARTQDVAAGVTTATFADLSLGVTYTARVLALRGTETMASPASTFRVPDPRGDRIAEIAATFPQSLHGTAKGMEYWYNRPDGFGAHAGVEYAGLGCGGCHAYNSTLTGVSAEQPCLACHTASATDPALPDYDNVDEAKCLKCHGRQAAEITMNIPDVHRTAGMACATCHTEAQIHGGADANTMFDVFDVSCTSCHTEGGSAPVAPSTTSHNVHGDGLACQSCHMSGSVTCYNCHFADEVERDTKVAFRRFADWLFLGNYRGKVYPLNFQSVEYGDETFNAWGPFHGHTITSEGRACNACHGNTNLATALTDGLAVTSWNAATGTMSHVTGVIPVPPNYHSAFRFDYVTREVGGPWFFLETGPDNSQMMYATPLTNSQVNSLLESH